MRRTFCELSCGELWTLGQNEGIFYRMQIEMRGVTHIFLIILFINYYPTNLRPKNKKKKLLIE